MSDSAASSPAVDVRNLSFRYAGAERRILNDVSFTATAGETLLILGPSGCGKSTLALCLNGLIPSEIEGELLGDVRIWGKSLLSSVIIHEQAAKDKGYAGLAARSKTLDLQTYVC